MLRLEVAVARLRKVADSEAEFRDLAQTGKNCEEWFAEADAKAAAGRGLIPNADQCIGFSVPLVLAESATPNPPYMADLYEHVSVLGDVNRQIAHLPDGTTVRLQLKRAPPRRIYVGPAPCDRSKGAIAASRSPSRLPSG